MIENKNATLFLVGNHGNFDTMVRHQLDDLSKIYPIKYFVVLAYMPNRKQPFDIEDEHTVLPEGIENVPYRFAIDYRNKWMLQQSDFVVTYIRHQLSGVWKHKESAKKQGKIIFELSQSQNEA
ncbi:MAG: hypothetical protein IJB86_09165 [Clostridia bacterium]|nr:hypothetical protein [Clostridia bacterium]